MASLERTQEIVGGLLTEVAMLFKWRPKITLLVRHPDLEAEGKDADFLMTDDTLEQAIAALQRLASLPASQPVADVGGGWVYWNPDAGEEYAPNHPIESGEVPNAERVRKSTGQEDHLFAEYQRGEVHRNDLADKVTAQSVEIGALNADRDKWFGRACDDALKVGTLTARVGALEGALGDLADCADTMPKKTPAAGSCVTEHQFTIEAGVIWALDLSVGRARAALASDPACKSDGETA